MEIFYDLDFVDINNINDVHLNDYCIKKNDIKLFFQVINDVIAWSKTCIYKKCFKDVYLVISDCPATPIEYVDFEPTMDKLYIHLNVLSLIWDYYERPIYRQIIFKEQFEETTLDTYIKFFFLHELGHIVHSQISTPNERTTILKFESHVLKCKPSKISLDRKYAIDSFIPLSEKEEVKLETEYRKLPHERVADSFAHKNLSL